MRIGVCSVGSELTMGDLTDTNAVWLSRRLIEIGADVVAHVSVGDDRDRIVAALEWLAGRCGAVVIGGGLGPTADDVTRDAVATLGDAELVFHDELAERIESLFRRVGRPMPPSNLRQAEVPAGAQIFPPVGTAPGFALEVPSHGCVLYALPGVPHEFREMVEAHVLPDLVERGGAAATVTRTARVAGMGESSVAARIDDVVARLEQAESDPSHPEHGIRLAFLSGPQAIRVRVSATAESREAAHARAEPVFAQILGKLGEAVSSIDDDEVEDEVARLLRLGGFTVATAESCTAGGVAARLARVPGATDYLRGGIVAYATDAKTDPLGVPADVVETHGPVAVETTEAMARAARERFAADIGIAVTGVAGPTAQGGREVGAVVWSLALPDGTVRTREAHLPGDREMVQRRAATSALESLRRHLVELGVDGRAPAEAVD
ncbi:MAG: CinA family nicotinamide mononucleotide deamidase-related protein [Nitriliruptorales bacterium]